MRDFLEDAFNHRDAGLGRAQKRPEDQLPRRFYREVSVVEVEDGYAPALDGRPTRTPGRVPVAVPARALAEALAAEWAAQETHIDPTRMPHVRLVNSALEGGEGARAGLLDEVVRFCGNDLLLYRADTPRELVALQEAAWDEALVLLARHFSVSFVPTVGIIHQPQSPETLGRLGASLSDADLLSAAALASIAGLTGSGLLAVALREGLLTPDAAWTAAHIDEDYQISLWGEDFEAAGRRAKRRIEFDAAVSVLGWMRDAR